MAAEEIALVARARREGMLRAYRNMLRREDLEDCLSQAVFELLARGARGQRFASREHVANALEQRFLSRVQDRRRAVRGRSPLQAHLESALPWSGPGERELELADPRAEVHPLVAHRFQLRQVARLAPLLTPDQRLVLACQVALGMEPRRVLPALRLVAREVPQGSPARPRAVAAAERDREIRGGLSRQPPAGARAPTREPTESKTVWPYRCGIGPIRARQ